MSQQCKINQPQSDTAASLQCYFLLGASPSTPIVYHVERVRQGRSYATVSVKAVQNGRTIFVLMCSFQKPEPWQPSHQWSMPTVPSPEDCELEETKYSRLLQSDEGSPRLRNVYRDIINVSKFDVSL